MAENENRREVLSGIAIFLLFGLAVASILASLLLFVSETHLLPSSLFAIASAIALSALTIVLRRRSF